MSEPTKWQPDLNTIAAAKEFIESNNLTHGKFADRLGGGFSTTRITKYLNLDKGSNTPEPDAKKVEVAIKQMLRHVARGKAQKERLFENSVSKDVENCLKQIRRTGDAGIIYSMAGHGKTSGAQLYCNGNPNTIYTVARKPYACSDIALLNMLLNEYLVGSSEQYDGTNKGLWLESRLRGTERLWIIDDAELLHMAAVKMVISLHDATGMAVAFIGNDDFVEKIRRMDLSGKLISRFGMVHPVARGDDESETARKLIQQFAPGSGEELVESVTATISGFGHCRRARKQLILANSIYEGAKSKDWTKAYESAGEQLVKVTNPART